MSGTVTLDKAVFENWYERLQLEPSVAGDHIEYVKDSILDVLADHVKNPATQKPEEKPTMNYNMAFSLNRVVDIQANSYDEAEEKLNELLHSEGTNLEEHYDLDIFDVDETPLKEGGT